MKLRFWKRKNRNGGVQKATKADIFAQRGDELMRARNYDTAIVMYGEALQFSPNDPELYLKRAAVFTCLNPARKDLALLDLERFAALNGSPTLATSTQAEILTRNGLLVSSAARDDVPDAGKVRPQTPLPQPPTAEEVRATRLRTVSPPNNVVPKTIDISRKAETSSPSQRPAQPALPLRGVEQQNVINHRDQASPNSLGDSRSNGETPLTEARQHETCGESNSPAPPETRYPVVGDDLSHPICNIEEENRDTIDEVPEETVFTIPQSIIEKLARGNINISDSFLTDPEPLFYASAYGHLDILEFIFAHIQQEHPHIKNNAVSWRGYPTPLNAALGNRRREAANFLMRHGAVFTERKANRKVQIADLISYAGDNAELLDRLICLKNEMVNSVPAEGEPFGTNNGAWALYFSFLHNNVRFVRYLWENGVREYVRTHEAKGGYTSLGHIYVLYHSRKEEYREVNQYLLSSGANKDLEDMWRRSHRLPRSQTSIPLPLPPTGTQRCPAGPGREESPFIEMEILRWE